MHRGALSKVFQGRERERKGEKKKKRKKIP